MTSRPAPGDGTVAVSGRGPAAVAVLAVLVVLAGATWMACSQPWAPISDLALIELQVRDVGHHTPLVGVYSRFGWNHPGPWMLWLLAVVYRALGSWPNGLLLGAVAINVVALLGIAAIARRRGGLPLLLPTLTALVLLMRAEGLGLVASAWSPHVALLPFTWLLFLVWDAACGRAWAVPLALGVASFVDQCHVSLVVPTLGLLAWGVGAALVCHGRSGRPSLHALFAVSAAIVTVFWLPPVIEQLTNHPGNARLIVRFFMAGHGPEGQRPLGARAAAAILAREVAGFAPWTGAFEPSNGPVAPRPPRGLVVPGVALAALAVLAHGRGDRDVVLGLATAGVAALTSWLAIVRLIGVAFTYLVRWTWAVGLFLDVMLVWALVRAVAPVLGGVVRRWSRPAASCAAAALLAFGALVVAQDRSQLPGELYAGSMRALTPTVTAWLRAHAARSVLLEPDWPGLVYPGLVAALERDGFEVAVPDRRVDFPPDRRAAGRDFDAHLVVGSGSVVIDRWSTRRDATLIASYAPATSEEDRAMRRIVVYAVGDATAAQR